MAELAAELGIAAGGVYHYFGGKEALLRRICVELTEPLHPRALTRSRAATTRPTALRALVACGSSTSSSTATTCSSSSRSAT